MLRNSLEMEGINLSFFLEAQLQPEYKNLNFIYL